jgi:ribosomal protein L7/L12
MDDAQLALRFQALEAQVKLLSDHLGLPSPPFPGAVQSASASEAAPTDDVPGDVLELARAGKTTQAISRYRQLTGATLLEAKRIVEAL